jgi:Glycosyltransferase (GlcNAc)
MSNIFVQIASYRDAELLPTLRDCIAKAAHPENLRFGICWQRDTIESLGKFLADPRFRVISIPYQDSKGVCWARNAIQSLYAGETYTLQLDSHHRFVPRWDSELIAMLESLDSEKAMLTTYAPHYDPRKAKPPKSVPWKIAFDKFTPDGRLLTRPSFIENDRDLVGPIPARFYSAHFAFTIGAFCEQVKHDALLYFLGEEITMAVRAFTHGYDLYHPHQVIVWHEYTRNYRRKHWDDHNSGGVPWHVQDAAAGDRIAALLGQRSAALDLGEFGLGKSRSLSDYEEYAGINFKLRLVQDYTRNDEPPPNPEVFSPDDWTTRLQEDFVATILLRRDQLPQAGDVDFWYIGLHDKAGTELFRQDMLPDSIEQLLQKDGPVRFDMNYRAACKAASWTIWPHSVSKGWLRRITGVPRTRGAG